MANTAATTPIDASEAKANAKTNGLPSAPTSGTDTNASYVNSAGNIVHYDQNAVSVGNATPSGAQINQASGAGVSPINDKNGNPIATNVYGTPNVSQPQITTPAQGVPNQTPNKPTAPSVPIWEKLGMTRDEYIAQNQARNNAAQNPGQVNTPINNPNASNNGVAAPQIGVPTQPTPAQNNTSTPVVTPGATGSIAADIQKKLPPKPTPPDTSKMSPEDAQKAQLAYQTSLADWYKSYGDEAAKQIGGISGQISGFSDQLKTYQGAIDNLVATLNKENPGAGSEVQKAIDDAKSQNSGNITPEILAAIQQMAETSKPEDIKTAASSILGNTVDTAALIGASKVEGGYMYKNSFVPMDANGNISLDPSTLPSNLNAGDYMKLELAAKYKNADIETQQAIRNADVYIQSAQRTENTTLAQIQRLLDQGTATAALNETQALKDKQFAQQREDLTYNSSIYDLSVKEGQTEGFLKAQLKAWGAEGSSAGLALMSKTQLDFIHQRNSIDQNYNLDSQQTDNAIQNIRDNYVNQVSTLTNNALTQTENANNTYMDALDKSFEAKKQGYENWDMKVNTAWADYSKEGMDIEKTKQQNAFQLYKDALDKQYTTMENGITNSGYVAAVGSDGKPTYALDANGNKIQSLQAKNLLDGTWTMTTNAFGETLLHNSKTNQVINWSDSGQPSPMGTSSSSGISFTVNGQTYQQGGTFPGNTSECVGGARLFNPDLPQGLVTLDQKRAIYSNIPADQIQQGDAVFFNVSGKDAPYGHAGTVVDVDSPNKKMLVVDNNADGHGSWGIREMDMSAIDFDKSTGKSGVWRDPNQQNVQYAALKQIGDQYYGQKLQAQQASNVPQKSASFMDTFPAEIKPEIQAAISSNPTMSDKGLMYLQGYDSKNGTDYAAKVSSYRGGDYSSLLGDNSKYTDALTHIFSGKTGLTPSGEGTVKTVADRLLKGDTNYAQDSVRSAVTESLGGSQNNPFLANSIFLGALKDMRDALSAASGQTGLKEGLWQKVQEAIGYTGNDKLAALNQFTKLDLHTYLKAQLGARGVAALYDTYAQTFPSTTKGSDLNAIMMNGIIANEHARMNTLVNDQTGGAIKDFSELLTPQEQADYFDTLPRTNNANSTANTPIVNTSGLSDEDFKAVQDAQTKGY